MMNTEQHDTGTGKVLSTDVNALSFDSALSTVAAWALRRESRAVYFCNAHSIAEGRVRAAFQGVLRRGDLRLPDGAPIAFMLRRVGFSDQRRVSGPDFMHQYMQAASERREAVFLYGSTPETLGKLHRKLTTTYPSLKIHSYSPPFRQLSEQEDAAAVELINSSGANTVWVALGCPKQEEWIDMHRGRIHAVMLGVGAAFAFEAGVISRAPKIFQVVGLEWLHRLCSDPQRLWKRYLVSNTAFLLFAASQLLKGRLSAALHLLRSRPARIS